MIKRNMGWRWMALLMIFAVLFCSGCGKKGDPLPPKAVLSQGAADFIQR